MADSEKKEKEGFSNYYNVVMKNGEKRTYHKTTALKLDKAKMVKSISQIKKFVPKEAKE